MGEQWHVDLSSTRFSRTARAAFRGRLCGLAGISDRRMSISAVAGSAQDGATPEDPAAII
jgi:hypothetical protein